MKTFATILISLLMIGQGMPVIGQDAPIRTLTAARIENPPDIDADLNDESWCMAAEEFKGNFYQLSPHNGELDNFETSVRITYDDEAIYIGAQMFDPNPELIPTELTSRDNIRKNVDYFGIVFDTYNKGQNGMAFYVTAAGVQADILMQRDDMDDNWNAVWESEVKINDKGWVVEMKIPYSALRLPKADIQTWGLNIVRSDRRNRIMSTWNFINREVDGMLNQSGTLLGIKNIKPPVRLSLMPYVSGLYKRENGLSNTSVNGGMDFKYGINESFTLDVTLIPDFSQVRSDNQVLNLSPFEVRFSENRPFFTEGTELFSMGNLFYSRRIGQSFNRLDYTKVSGSEEVLSTPANAPLINASKISGRTSGGTGLGIFNALTSATFAEVKDTLSGEIRQVKVDNLTNFNVLVIDQNLKNNSSIGLINTNVFRGQNEQNANVALLQGTLRDKSNTYSLFTGLGHSRVMKSDNEKATGGYKYFMHFSKVSGNFQFNTGYSAETDNWDINDMGYQRFANQQTYGTNFRYNIFKPFSIFNSLNSSIDFNLTRLYSPAKYQEFSTGTRIRAEFNNFWDFSVMVRANPIGGYDYYEPRVSGADFGNYFFKERPSFFSHFNAGTDSRKSFRLGARMFMWRRPFDNAKYTGFEINPRYRANDKFTLSAGIDVTNGLNNKGYVSRSSDPDIIYFGNRIIKTITSEMSLTYNFTNKMNINLRGRNYWSRVGYNDFFELQSDGNLMSSDYDGFNSDGSTKHDADFTVFNIDLNYSWQIAPGSFLNITYKTQNDKYKQLLGEGYLANLSETISNEGSNTVNVKLIYYIDAGRWL